VALLPIGDFYTMTSGCPAGGVDDPPCTDHPHALQYMPTIVQNGAAFAQRPPPRLSGQGPEPRETLEL
jgi:hypothetical protein